MKILQLLIFIILPVLFVACIPATQMEERWSEPSLDADSTREMKKVLFAALLKDQATRRLAEDKLVASYHGKGVASYQYLAASGVNTEKTMIAERLKKDGFEGIVVMRLLDKKVLNAPGTYPSYYGNWLDYYNHDDPSFNNPGGFNNSSTYIIETNVYSLLRDKLVWNGVVSTVNFADPGRMIDNVIKTMKDQMKSKGLIK